MRMFGKSMIVIAALGLWACGKGEKEETKLSVQDLDADFVSADGTDQLIAGKMPEAAIVRFEYDETTGAITKVGQVVPVSASSDIALNAIEETYASLAAEKSISQYSSADSFPSANFCHPGQNFLPGAGFGVGFNSTSVFQSCGGHGLPMIPQPIDFTQNSNNTTITNITNINNTNITNTNINQLPVQPQFNMWQPNLGVGMGGFGCSTTVVTVSQWCNNGSIWSQNVGNMLRPVTYFPAQSFQPFYGQLPYLQGRPVFNTLRAGANGVRGLLYRAALPRSAIHVPRRGVGYAAYCRTSNCNVINNFGNIGQVNVNQGLGF